jgi:hypothetical protein
MDTGCQPADHSWQAETPALLDYEFKILTSSFLLYALCSMLYAFANLQSAI